MKITEEMKSEALDWFYNQYVDPTPPAHVLTIITLLQPSPQQELKNIKRYGVTADCTFPLAKQVNIPQPDKCEGLVRGLEDISKIGCRCASSHIAKTLLKAYKETT